MSGAVKFSCRTGLLYSTTRLACCTQQAYVQPRHICNMLLSPTMPPAFVQERAAVSANRKLARDTYLIRLIVPDIARRIRPGQFVMLRVPGSTDPLLGRPFALYDTVLDERGAAVGIDVVYLVVGK